MLVTVLYRLEGKPKVTGTNSFTDMKSGQWYTEAVIWANANGVVFGCGDGIFGTEDSITREQMAALLFCYASYKKYDTSNANDLANFTDADGILCAWCHKVGQRRGPDYRPHNDQISAGRHSYPRRDCHHPHALLGFREDLPFVLEPLKELLMLLKKSGGATTILHTDQGSQYSSPAFTTLLKKHGLIQSMSHEGTYI